MKEESKAVRGPEGGISRRDFMGGAAAVAAFTIVPSHVLGAGGKVPPSDKLNVAAAGAGGMGAKNIENISGENGENIVALCDVDDARAAETYDKFPNAKKYRDFRRMLDRQKDIDAVIIATPDHTHAVIAMMAMKMGKHVYVQKPLTRTVYEARMLTEAARKYKVATQMGNQGHSGEGVRLTCEWLWGGAIGDIREVHCWTNRPIWPQGIERPGEIQPVPDSLDWDLWLGPAPQRPYNPAYVPFKWRGFWDFGTGALGDMACHVLDPVFSALKLGYPTQVEASFTKTNEETAPLASIIHYNFPARGDMPSVKLHWYDGGLLPARPEEIEQGRRLPQSGTIFVGSKGKLMCGTYGESPRIIPEAKMKQYSRPKKTIARIDGNHEQDWARACKGGKPACSNFDYSGPLTETVVMGNLAIRSGQKLDWDGVNMKVTNAPEANKFVHYEYRQGWTL